MEGTSTMTTDTSIKRPRSASFGDGGQPLSKTAKTSSNHVQINYLARQYTENIPLVNADDTLPSILRLIGDYEGVFLRHESIAGNLGACPLGPILLKRFDRLFDGPPRILKSHGKDTNVTWLDVVEFARNKPEQFNLEKTRNGVRVCQFYTKQSRVEISEEDYVLIASGMPQKLIPPQPIMEDEEKELSALDILEKNLTQVINLADQASARARQLNHRLKGRRSAIMSRRAETQGMPQPYSHTSYSPPPPPPPSDYTNGHSRPNGSIPSPPAAFTTVNIKPTAPETGPDLVLENTNGNSPYTLSHPTSDKPFDPTRVTIVNGVNVKGMPPETKNELVKHFIHSADREARLQLAQADEDRRKSQPFPPSRPTTANRAEIRAEPTEFNSLYVKNPAVAIPSTPVPLLPPHKPTQAERDDGGPYKAEMVARMEQMHRGERIIPPCDRCRRLHMDCLKNLTACLGCTKKHAKCSWKDVRIDELRRSHEEALSADVYEHASLPRSETASVDRDKSNKTVSPVPAPFEPNSNNGSLPKSNQAPSAIALTAPASASVATPATNSYYTEEDDITRAILEEKEEPTDEQKRADANQQSAQRSAPPVSLIEQQHQPADTVTSVPTNANTTSDNGPGLTRKYETVSRPQSAQFPPPRSEYQYVRRSVDMTRRDDDDSDDEGDRLQKAAQEVYRSASARPL